MDPYPQGSVLQAKPKRKAPVDRPSPVGAGPVTDQQKTQFDSVEISPEEAVIFTSQESELPSMTTAKTEVVKSKEELLMEQFKAKEEEVRRLNELLELRK